jgi:hypothetical protein
MMTVLHLETGQVLAVAAVGIRELTVDELTGGRHLAVRLPGSDQVVEVGPELLTATSAARDDDVLDRPLDFRVGAGTPPITYGGTPIDLGTGTGTINVPDGTAVISLWQAGDELEVARGQIVSQVPDGSAPPGATHRLVAVQDQPLAYETGP